MSRLGSFATKCWLQHWKVHVQYAVYDRDDKATLPDMAARLVSWDEAKLADGIGSPPYDQQVSEA